MTSSITENLNRVRAEITRAAIASHRDVADVRLIAVSKTKPAAQVLQALASGQSDFGENYVQEAVAKIREVAAAGPATAPVWHFIGAIQANKTRDLATCFDWVHSVDREKIARRLHDQRPLESGRLNICLQVNVDADPDKAGISIDEAATLLERCSSYENLAVRGLMTILDPRKPPQEGYNRLRDLFEALTDQAPPTWDTLSMGMSGDYPAAIKAGATLVRVGTAIFGQRDH